METSLKRLSLFILLLQTESSNGCKPAQENTAHVFRITIHHTLEAPLETLLLKDKIPVSMCKPSLAYYEYSELRAKSSVRYLGDGRYEFTIIIKNVTRSDEGKWTLKYLGKASLKSQDPLFECQLNVYAVSVLALENCLDIVEEGTEAHCLCRIQNGTNYDMTFGWYDNNGSIFNDLSPFLTYRAARANTGYECRGKTESGLVNQLLKYEPFVVVKSDLIECALNSDKEEINISCHVQRIFPQAVFEFEFIGDDKNLQTYKECFVYKNSPWPKDNAYYSSECVLSLRSMRQYNLIFYLTVYPNVTGNNNDSEYGTTQFFHLRTPQNEFFEDINDPKIEYVIWSCTFVSLLIVSFVIALLTYKCLVKRNKDLKVSLNFPFCEDRKTLKDNFYNPCMSDEKESEKSLKFEYDNMRSISIFRRNNRTIIESVLYDTVINDSEESEGYVSQDESLIMED